MTQAPQKPLSRGAFFCAPAVPKVPPKLGWFYTP